MKSLIKFITLVVMIISMSNYTYAENLTIDQNSVPLSKKQLENNRETHFTNYANAHLFSREIDYSDGDVDRKIQESFAQILSSYRNKNYSLRYDQNNSIELKKYYSALSLLRNIYYASNKQDYFMPFGKPRIKTFYKIDHEHNSFIGKGILLDGIYVIPEFLLKKLSYDQVSLNNLKYDNLKTTPLSFTEKLILQAAIKDYLLNRFLVYSHIIDHAEFTNNFTQYYIATNHFKNYMTEKYHSNQALQEAFINLELFKHFVNNRGV